MRPVHELIRCADATPETEREAWAGRPAPQPTYDARPRLVPGILIEALVVAVAAFVVVWVLP